MKKTPFQIQVDFVLAATRKMLYYKNKAYGNSALEPIRIFSRSDTIEQLKVRIDDKLSRIGNMDGDIDAANGFDQLNDLIGYLILLRIALKEQIKK